MVPLFFLGWTTDLNKKLLIFSCQQRTQNYHFLVFYLAQVGLTGTTKVYWPFTDISKARDDGVAVATVGPYENYLYRASSDR